MKSKKQKIRTARAIPGKSLPIKIYTLCALNDGRIPSVVIEVYQFII